MPITMPEIKFASTGIYSTPGAIAALEASGDNAGRYLLQHFTGNWGGVCEEDGESNDSALLSGARIISSYLLKDETKIWIITEAEGDGGVRAATTILLPEEY